MAHPNSACSKRGHTALETRLLTLTCNALVHTFAQPDVRLHVPRVKKYFKVWCELDVYKVHVRCAGPQRRARGTVPSEAQPSEDARTLGERPDGVVFRSLDDTAHLEVRHSAHQILSALRGNWEG